MNNKIRLSRTSIVSFVISYVVTLCVLILQLVWLYYDEIAGKKISLAVIARFLFFTALSMGDIAFPIAICIMAVVHYRAQSRRSVEELSTIIRKSVKSAISWFVITFAFAAFITPIGNLHAVAILYSMRSMTPEEPIIQTEIALFKDAPMTQNIIELYASKKNAEANLNTISEQLVEYAKQNSSEVFKQQLFNNSILSELDIPYDSLRYSPSGNETIPDAVLEMAFTNFHYAALNIQQYQLKIARIYKQAIMSLLLFYSGLFLGILNRRNKLILLMLGLIWVFLPIVYITNHYIMSMSLQQYGVNAPTLLSLLTITLITIILYQLCRKSLKSKNISVFDIPNNDTDGKS